MNKQVLCTKRKTIISLWPFPLLVAGRNFPVPYPFYPFSPFSPPPPPVDFLIISCQLSSQAEEKKRQEEEEMLSKKLHEEQALHEAQLKEVCKNNLCRGEAHLSKIRKYGSISDVFSSLVFDHPDGELRRRGAGSFSEQRIVIEPPLVSRLQRVIQA